ncbi:MAG: TonB family protein [Gemmatimonas sp.]|nr:TonB family protein [Gemmatimonas sp.]
MSEPVAARSRVAKTFRCCWSVASGAAGDFSLGARHTQGAEVRFSEAISHHRDSFVVVLVGSLTIARTTFESMSSEPPPPPVRSADLSDEPAFTPYEIRPTLRNPDAYARELLREYPATLRDAGIGGTVLLWVFIDEEGGVQRTRVTESSGFEQLDRIAEEVMGRVASFTPATNRDQRVPVWIQLPVTFRAEDR